MSQATDLEKEPVQVDLRPELVRVIKETKPDPFYTRIFDAITEAVRDDNEQTSNRLSMAIDAIEERARDQAYDWGYEAGYQQAARDLQSKT